MFFLALVANASIIIQIPYTLPLLSAALGGAGFVSMLLLGVASGLGAGIGAIAGYKVADALVGRTPRRPTGGCSAGSPATSTTGRGPRSSTIFGIAASPLPDTTVVHAVGARALRPAPCRDAAVPRQVRPQRPARAALLRVRVVVGGPRVEQASTDLALAVAVIFMLLVCYSRREGRAGATERRTGPKPASRGMPADAVRPNRLSAAAVLGRDRGSNCS